MSEPRDLIDEWLSTDVELLNPRPGTFERVHRTARRRKTARAVSTLAGVAVVIAAAGATLPLLPGGGQPNVIARKTTGPSAHSTGPSSSPSPTQSASQAGAVALGSTGQTHPPAPAFQPTSVTFVGSGGGGLVGAVIGQANCPSGPCTSLAGTPDYGRTWYKVGAPPVGPPNGAQGVSQVRFADPSNGWSYGPQLFATHNGGLAWTKITVPSQVPGQTSGRVIDLAAMSGRAFAVTAYGCRGTGQHYAANCTSFALLSSSVHANSWHVVRGASTGIGEAPGGLQLSQQRGYLMTKGLLYAGPTAGGAWHPVPNTAPSVPPCLRGGHLGPWLLAPGSPTLFLVCGAPGSARPALYTSGDQGLAWQRQGTVTESGTPSSLAVAPTSGSLVLATSTGIYYSTDQKSWHRAKITGEPTEGFRYVGMTTTLQGVAVPVDSQLGEIFTTADGGLTWQPSAIR